MRRSPNVTWQEGLSRGQRWGALGAPGATVWLTGLPASGKSTIGAALEERLVSAGRFAYLLDGDNLRHGICGDLGFSADDRERNISRVAEVAQLFADAGAVAIVALVSPIASSRRTARRLHERRGLRFIEVFVDTPLEVCAARDPKHLYARARAGEIHGFTGVDDPYERPAEAELVLTDDVGPSAAVDAVLELLEASDESAAGDRPAPPERQNPPVAPPGTTQRQNGVQR
ncbi:MAG: adenylyl-sulfate kinase [Solirubrobacteraceae bacterium]